MHRKMYEKGEKVERKGDESEKWERGKNCKKETGMRQRETREDEKGGEKMLEIAAIKFKIRGSLRQRPSEQGENKGAKVVCNDQRETNKKQVGNK